MGFNSGLKTSEIRASVIEDMKSRRALATACHLFALASSTLHVKCSSATCKVSVIAFFFPDDLNMTPFPCPPHERQGSSGQRSLVTDTSQSVCFARSFATGFQAGQPHVHTCVCPLKWVLWKGGLTRVHAGRWHAGRSLRNALRC
jgi:hypothetical protein